MIYVTGDWHGGFGPEGFWNDRFDAERFPEGLGLTKRDLVIVLGDFSWPFDFSDEEESDMATLARKPWVTCFLDGNHEHFDYLDGLRVSEWRGGAVQRYPEFPSLIHLMRGQVYELESKRVLVMGGAQSAGGWREPGLTWFEREMPSTDEMQACRQALDAVDWQVDYVLSHTCASSLLPAALGAQDGNSAGAGAHGSVVTDQLTDFFEELEGKLTYTHWYFGHFHRDDDIDARHTVLFDTILPLRGTLFPA